MLIDCDKAFDWLTTSRDVNAEFKGIGRLKERVSLLVTFSVQRCRDIRANWSLSDSNPTVAVHIFSDRIDMVLYFITQTRLQHQSAAVCPTSCL